MPQTARRATARDPFAVLGIPYTATADDARRAFRRLAMETHPDRNPGVDGAPFRAAREAHDALEADFEGCRHRWGVRSDSPDTARSMWEQANARHRRPPQRPAPVEIDPAVYPPARVQDGAAGGYTVDPSTLPTGWTVPATPPPGALCLIVVQSPDDGVPWAGVWMLPSRFRMSAPGVLDLSPALVWGPPPSN